jgi:hypothetical protein
LTPQPSTTPVWSATRKLAMIEKAACRTSDFPASAGANRTSRQLRRQTGSLVFVSELVFCCFS